MKSYIQRPNNKTQPSVVCEPGCVSLVYVVWGRSSKNTTPELFNNSHIWTFCIGKVRRWTIPEEPHPLDRVWGRFTQNTHLAEGVLAYEVHSLQKPAHFIHSDKSYLIFIIVFIVTEPQGVAFRVIHLPKTCTPIQRPVILTVTILMTFHYDKPLQTPVPTTTYHMWSENISISLYTYPI
jgi:hypothetical protein